MFFHNMVIRQGGIPCPSKPIAFNSELAIFPGDRSHGIAIGELPRLRSEGLVIERISGRVFVKRIPKAVARRKAIGSPRWFASILCLPYISKSSRQRKPHFIFKGAQLVLQINAAIALIYQSSSVVFLSAFFQRRAEIKLGIAIGRLAEIGVVDVELLRFGIEGVRLLPVCKIAFIGKVKTSQRAVMNEAGGKFPGHKNLPHGHAAFGFPTSYLTDYCPVSVHLSRPHG